MNWTYHTFAVRHLGRTRHVEIFSPVPLSSTMWALGKNDDEDASERTLWTLDAAFRALTARKKPTDRELETFYREMSRLLAGRKIDFKTSLSLVAPLAETPLFRGIIAGLYHYREQVEDRAALFARFPQAFGPAEIAQIRKGIASGSEDEVFAHLADELRERGTLKKKIYAALFMPAIVFVGTMASLILLNVFVLPKIAASFQALRYNLPAPTRFVIWLNRSVFSNPVVIVTGIASVLWMVSNHRKIIRSRMFQRLWLRTPGFGRIYQKAILARCLRTLAQLYQVRLPQRDAFSIAADVASNHEVREFLQAVSRRLTDGMRMHEGFLAERHRLGREGNYLSARLRISQPTGDEADVLADIAELYKQDTIFAADTLPQLIEPIAYVLIGGVLLLLVLAITLPDLDFAFNTMKESLSYGPSASH